MNPIVGAAIQTARNFNPKYLMRNPVMFITECAFALSIVIAIEPAWFGAPTGSEYVLFYIAVVANLFLTLLFLQCKRCHFREQEQGHF